ncbi:MAG: response regulator [Anaerolineae bacterium]|nr:response regulator [Anaerolineae bacterium]
MIDLVRVVLSRGNINLIGITEGREGLNTVRTVKPDLVLLDLMLPDMGGWAIYQQMKNEAELRDIPVIVVTAQDAPIDRLLGEHIAMVQVYITKPFSPMQLLASVKEVLGIAA